jgi:hypothetical protein
MGAESADANLHLFFSPTYVDIFDYQFSRRCVRSIPLTQRFACPATLRAPLFGCHHSVPPYVWFVAQWSNHSRKSMQKQLKGAVSKETSIMQGCVLLALHFAAGDLRII